MLQTALQFLSDHNEIAFATCEGNLPKIRVFQFMRQEGTQLFFATSAQKIPRVPGTGKPVAMNLRCDDTFVEDAHWHGQCERYQRFVAEAHRQRLLLLEFGVGFNTPAIIRFPFEQMAVRFPQTTLVRFNRDYPQLTTEGVKRFIPFTEDMKDVMKTLHASK